MYIANVRYHHASTGAERRSAAWLALGGATALAIPACFGAIVGSDGPTLCPFRLATGLPCPGCGATRALAATARGDLDAAVGLTPVWPVLAVAAMLLGVAGLLLAGRGARPATRVLVLLRGTDRERPRRALAIGAAFVIVAWAWALANRGAIVG